MTKERCSEKPDDYDGEYIIGQEANKKEIVKYDHLDFTKRFCTPLDEAPVRPALIKDAGAGTIG